MFATGSALSGRSCAFVCATVAALFALAIASSLNFPLQGLWMVLTAVVVTRVSVGGSLCASLDYVLGTLARAVYAAAIGPLVPHVTVLGQAVALTLAVAPLALAAALRPSFRVARSLRCWCS